MLTRAPITLLLIAGISLSACAGGFKPLYGNSSGVAGKLASLSVAEQKNRSGQLVRNEILDGSNLDAPQYQVSLSVTESIIEIARFSSSSAARSRLTLSGHYELRLVGADETLTSGNAVVNVEYDLVKLPVADLQTVEHARVRASKLLGQDIKQRLAAALASLTD